MKSAPRSTFKVRFRPYERASDLEKSIAERIVEEEFPGRHKLSQIKQSCFSRQNLFLNVGDLQYITIIPSKSELDYAILYITQIEGSDNSWTIGENRIADCNLCIHSGWIIEGAKVLSSIIDGQWVGYVYDGQNYILNAPGLTDLSALSTAGSELSRDTVRSALKRIDFDRGYEDLRDFEQRALDIVKEKNGDFYSDSDYRALSVSAQYLSRSARSGEVDVIFRIERVGDGVPGEQPIYHEIARRISGGTFVYAGFLEGLVGLNQQKVSISREDYFNGYYGLVQEIGEEKVVEILKYVFDGLEFRVLSPGNAQSSKGKLINTVNVAA